MKYMKKAAAVILSVLVLGLTLAGCEISLNDTDQVAVVYGKEEIMLDEAKLYVYEAQRQVELENEFLIAYYYGGFDTFWEESWGYNLTSAMQQLYQTKFLVDLAKQEGMTLTAEETERMEAGIERFKKEADIAIHLAGADESLVRKYVEENAIAVKYYLQMVGDVDTNFDYETFRRKSLIGVTITAKTTIPTPTEEATEPVSGEESESTTEAPTEAPSSTEAPETTEAPTYSEERRGLILRETLEAVKAMFDEGKTVAEVVDHFRSSLEANVTTLGSVEVAPSDAREDANEAYGTYREIGWDMATGEIRAEIVINSSGNEVGYVLLCEDDDSEEGRRKAEEDELVKRKAALFAEKYQELIQKSPEFHVYETKIANIRYKNAIIESALLTPSTTEAEAEGTTGEEGTAAN
ncbi:MAG: hypothetical protein J5794_04760 [Lachnospiraceae bacterium]|nr:hypothetical protein [Lachnospiraceae bacterium]